MNSTGCSEKVLIRPSAFACSAELALPDGPSVARTGTKATSKSKHDLALRVALLIAETRDDAEHVASTVLGLYKHRNEIAHGSHANIGEADMRAAQSLVTRAVVAVAKSDALAKMRSEEEADRHFHRLALASLPG